MFTDFFCDDLFNKWVQTELSIVFSIMSLYIFDTFLWYWYWYPIRCRDVVFVSPDGCLLHWIYAWGCCQAYCLTDHTPIWWYCTVWQPEPLKCPIRQHAETATKFNCIFKHFEGHNFICWHIWTLHLFWTF